MSANGLKLFHAVSEQHRNNAGISRLARNSRDVNVFWIPSRTIRRIIRRIIPSENCCDNLSRDARRTFSIEADESSSCQLTCSASGDEPSRNQLCFKKIMNIQIRACERSGTAMDVYIHL